jgi:glycerophosphoryl diester phosphodiesterase
VFAREDGRELTPDEVNALWEQVKVEERAREEAAAEARGGRPEPLLDSVSSGMPALIQAQKISRKAVNCGFEWDTVDDVWEQVFSEIAELREAQEMGAWGSEFDVHMTKDDVIVVNHDETIDGILIQSANYADLKDCRLVNGEPLPTLDDYLTQGEKGGTVLVLELKPQIDKAHEDYMVDQSVAALKKHGLYDPKKVIFISFSWNICQRIAALCPGFTNQFLSGNKTPDEVVSNGVNGIDYHYGVFQKNPTWVKEAHDRKMSVNVWTVDKEENIKEMIDLNVDCITTNEPLKVRQILGGKEQK